MRNAIVIAVLSVLFLSGCAALGSSPESAVLKATVDSIALSVEQLEAQGEDLSDGLKEVGAVAAGASAGLEQVRAADPAGDGLSASEQVAGTLVALATALGGYHAYRQRGSVERVAKANAMLATAAKQAG